MSDILDMVLWKKIGHNLDFFEYLQYLKHEQSYEKNLRYIGLEFTSVLS